MKIAHEAPLSIFDKVQGFTDYDYALVHLFEENEQYWDTFVDAKNKGREIILDNSIFELGTSFKGDTYVKWIEKLQPEWYIIPDVLDNAHDTIENFEKFLKDYPDLPGKAIAVAQGSKFNELRVCYEHFAKHPKVEKIGISFNSPFFQELGLTSRYHNMMVGRRTMLRDMVEMGIINENKKHHLLGAGLPQEFTAYHYYKWIDSVDTSNPVIHGIKGVRYETWGLNDKETVKLYTLINEDVTDKWDDVCFNISAFRRLCNG